MRRNFQSDFRQDCTMCLAYQNRCCYRLFRPRFKSWKIRVHHSLRTESLTNSRTCQETIARLSQRILASRSIHVRRTCRFGHEGTVGWINPIAVLKICIPAYCRPPVQSPAKTSRLNENRCLWSLVSPTESKTDRDEWVYDFDVGNSSKQSVVFCRQLTIELFGLTATILLDAASIKWSRDATRNEFQSQEERIVYYDG